MREAAEFLSNLIEVTPVWMSAVVLFVCILVALWIVKSIVFFYLRCLIDKSNFVFDSLLLDAARRPTSVLIFAISLKLTELILISLISSSIEHSDLLGSVSQIFFIVAMIMFADKFARVSLTHYQDSSPILKTSGSLLKGTLRVIVFCIGLLIILSTLGVSITPIVASLGIGSLAVALALQPTLENFFSGIQMIADKPLRVGDFVELDSGEQGFVEKIGWRSTWIKMLPNNIVIMPNSVLAQSKLINYYYPEKQLSVPVDVGVHYDSDLDHVERVTLEVAKEILRTHKWGIPEYETFVVFHTFDNSSINFTVMLRAQEYFNRFFIKSAFIKALHKRFKDEGIVIPYPISAINLSQESATDNLINHNTK
ncbi:mechanosensitive ion channel family protein [Paraglaciecola sp. 2405UD69-4]|uniref:mechanosensitive ion channel family protein n=1 Tax=Paraglaciecola sp. 2405UD69-4 TaxID=3391836 RepID=UPI0039C92AF2